MCKELLTLSSQSHYTPILRQVFDFCKTLYESEGNDFYSKRYVRNQVISAFDTTMKMGYIHGLKYFLEYDFILSHIKEKRATQQSRASKAKDYILGLIGYQKSSEEKIDAYCQDFPAFKEALVAHKKKIDDTQAGFMAFATFAAGCPELPRDLVALIAHHLPVFRNRDPHQVLAQDCARFERLTKRTDLHLANGAINLGILNRGTALRLCDIGRGHYRRSVTHVHPEPQHDVVEASIAVNPQERAQALLAQRQEQHHAQQERHGPKRGRACSETHDMDDSKEDMPKPSSPQRRRG